jgi:hypothetical protein
MTNLSRYSMRDLKALRINAQNQLKKGADPKKLDATVLLRQIDEEIEFRSSKRPQRTGIVDWKNNGIGHYVGFMNGKRAIEIHKDENHTSDNEEVYTVYVLGVRWQKRFRYIDDARREAAATLSCDDA